MSRLTHRQYERHLMLAMAVYVAVMLGIWPSLRTTQSLPMKVILALSPVLPMLYVLALMARRIRDSDELEQRTHLLALGVATGVVGGLSMIGGFLASARVLSLDGTILIMVFPALLFCYGIARWWFARRYGGGMACSEEGATPAYRAFALLALIMGGVALIFHRTLGHDRLWALSGLAVGFAVAALLFGWVHWRARRLHTGSDSR